MPTDRATGAAGSNPTGRRQSPFSSRSAVGEALAVGLGGGFAAALTGLGAAAALDLDGMTTTLVAGVVGAANGVISGGRGIYDWRSRRGWIAWLLDSTWALLSTFGAVVVHVLSVLQRRRGGYVGEWSRRRNRHVYRGGLRIRRGFLTTVGNVVSGVGPGGTRRRHVVDHHEDVHVSQARWFGPLFPLLYGGWTLIAGPTAALWWALRRLARRRPRRSFGASVDAVAYYCNPFEWWAYSREGRWPPPGRSPVWPRPMVARRRR